MGFFSDLFNPLAWRGEKRGEFKARREDIQVYDNCILPLCNVHRSDTGKYTSCEDEVCMSFDADDVSELKYSPNVISDVIVKEATPDEDGIMQIVLSKNHDISAPLCSYAPGNPEVDRTCFAFSYEQNKAALNLQEFIRGRLKANGLLGK